MKRKTVIFFFLFLTMTLCYGQKKDSANIYRIPSNSFYLEISGNSLFYSQNYERKIISKKLFTLSGRIGASCFPPYPNEFMIYGFPLLINGLFHCYKGLFFELSTGVLLANLQTVDRNYYTKLRKVSSEFNVFYLGNVGIRYQGRNGFLFRTGITPHYDFRNSRCNFLEINTFWSWIGFSIGYSFDRKK